MDTRCMATIQSIHRGFNKQNTRVLPTWTDEESEHHYNNQSGIQFPAQTEPFLERQ